MKKKILALALVAVSFAGFEGMAETVSPTDVTTEKSVKPVKVCKKDIDKCDNYVRFNPYEGLTLTEAQKTQLQNLDNSIRQKKIEAKQADKAAKQARKAEKKEMKKERMEARKAERKAYLEQVKSIIGPDQYVIFLENSFVSPAPRPDKAFDHAGKDGKVKMMSHSASSKNFKEKSRKDKK